MTQKNKTRTPLSSYQVTMFAIEICKLQNATSEDAIEKAAYLAFRILKEIENQIQDDYNQELPNA